MPLHLYILLAATTSAPLAQEPSVAPMTTCIKTTIDQRGRFTDSKVVAGSGSSSVDRDALQLIKGTDLSRLFPRRVERQTGYVLVSADETGAVTLGFAGKLLDSCPDNTGSGPAR